MKELPIVDVTALHGQSPRERQDVAAQLYSACTSVGFFYIIGHGIDETLQRNLEELSQGFFARPQEEKLDIRMERARQAWRGYFPLGGELTSGKPDWKEGLYFGKEHSPDHPHVIRGTPLYGQNLFPEIPEFRRVVVSYMNAMADLAQKLLAGIALSLDIPEDYFRNHFTEEPTELFRIFHYPPPPAGNEIWGVGEHTDYGLLTILKQDDVGGLEVKTPDGWTAAPPVTGSFVCNLGDMLDRLTGGLYRSTPHRVNNASKRERYSYPYFFDPNFDAQLAHLPIPDGKRRLASRSGAGDRWDGRNVHEVEGSYGEYLLGKIGKVFPELKGKT